MKDSYQNLREHLDRLPGGYPATESGVEIRILKRLFNPEEAELAPKLTMNLETAEAIAARTGLNEQEVEQKLKDMSRKGLIFSIETPGRPTVFMAAQFVIGIWEYNVNRLDKDLIRDLEEYFPILSAEALSYLPPLRTIPVGKSISADLHIMAYEQAESLVKSQKKFLVAPCICRREHQIKGGECGKPVENCLVFGWGVDFYERNGIGRVITLDEALEILKAAEKAGLVLQPSNSQEITNICCCCGDCCQVLQHLKRQPIPAAFAAAPFVVQADRDSCVGCEICLSRCQMEALQVNDGMVSVDSNRCIGCGLCVSTCSGAALTLIRSPETPKWPIP
ncbi:MAG: 4Fe-4S binding protein, partial [Deltaproteobacteria bacterium]|nr:4Fe-4S binding protein [Deltaproteobacteria bacterium]